MGRTKTRLLNVIALSAVSLALLAFAPSAFATSSAQSVCPPYCDTGGKVQSQVNGGSNDTTSGTTSAGTGKSKGSLPFTGLDLGLLIAGGAVLLLVGGSLRRLSRHSTA